MASNFDPDTFLALNVDQPMDTKYTPIPEGTYPAMIEEVKPKIVTSNKDGTEYLVFEIFYRIDDEQARQITGRDRLRSRQSVFIERTSQGGIDSAKGKNIPLGRVRDAVGQNTPGQPWAPSMLIGAACRAKIKHNKRGGGEDLFDEVEAITKL